MVSSKTKRITITVPEIDLIQWNFMNNQISLSAFIRDAVNQYILELNNENEQNTDISKKVENNRRKISKIEVDLIEIQAAMAKRNIIPEYEQLEARIMDFINQKTSKKKI
ncbi:MAG: hypothetical protein ACTSVU_06685 [Promethearchaeota archaeon]